MNRLLVIILVLVSQFSFAGNDSATTKAFKWPTKFCTPRIVGMSPNKVISLGYDYEFGQTLKSSDLGSFDKNAEPPVIETTKYKRVSGLRFSAKAPIINNPKIIWQFGLNYWAINYVREQASFPVISPKFGAELTRLTTAGMNTSVYKPLNAKEFLIFQTSVDLNGDYKLGNLHPLKYLRYSGVVMYGKRVHDRKQWALGVARGYNAGQVTILPMVMFNYTSPNKKWGAEIMLPARAWYRYSIDKNSLFRAGFELEGASYHLSNINTSVSNMELRRGQLRFKGEYQCKLYKSFWIALQPGYCTMLNFNLDAVGTDGKDFSRQFDSKKKYAMINDLSDFFFLNLSINFVSL